MSINTNEAAMFEVLIDSYPGVITFRYEAPEYSWQYSLIPGSLEVVDNSRVEVLKTVDDETKVVAWFAKVLAVGEVTDESCLSMPSIRIRRELCPRCGTYAHLYQLRRECDA